MSIRNEHRDGPPTGLWARCAENPQGVVGVAFGYDLAQTGFIPAEVIPDFCVSHAAATGAAADIVRVVRAAATGLGAFRHSLQTTRAAASN